MKNKLKAIKALILAGNYIVITDYQSIGSVSPLHAEKFRQKLNTENERQRLAVHRHERTLEQVADSQLSEH